MFNDWLKKEVASLGRELHALESTVVKIPSAVWAWAKSTNHPVVAAVNAAPAPAKEEHGVLTVQLPAGALAELHAQACVPDLLI